MLRGLTQPSVLALTVFGACAGQRSAVSDQVSLTLDSSAERRISLRDVAIEPADNVRSARLDARGSIAIERVEQSRPLWITAPNMCPVSVSPGPHPDALTLQPVLSLGGDRVGIGFDARFTVQAQFNCSPSGQANERIGEIRWQQLEGSALPELQVSDAGYTLTARTSSFADDVPQRQLVPISPRTQGRVVLQARWEGPGFPPATRQVVISATARATGLSSVAVSQPLVLEGLGWSVKTRPPGGRASVKVLEGMTFFTADAPGSWTLAQGGEHTLKVQSLTHDATPYDCGRAECHAALSEHTAESAMSHALQRPLEAGADSAAISCMLDCHVLGERGLSDGGFQAVAARLGFTWTEHTRWEDLPQALRRAGGVRCTACHGPGAIPPPEQRSAILESDVCATCHDAPPRYVHVTQWRSSRMATSDRDPSTRQPECARCHTTAGFLAHNGVRKLSDETPRAQPTGIACAACHAPHSGNRGPRLIRNVEAAGEPTGELFPEPASVLCRSCHAPMSPSQGQVAPSGSLFASEILVPARGGDAWERFAARSVHEQVPRGCIGCHGGGALQTNALDHSFRAEPRVCATCHADDALQLGRDASAELRARALALSRTLATHCQSDSAHAPHSQLAPSSCSSSVLERARYEANLVLDDNAALFHNADLARALLDDVDQILKSFQGL